ncbi:MAG: hypothetical protein ACI8PQ_003381 [Planctomycetota bacterium]|jgi:hypothetical protein
MKKLLLPISFLSLLAGTLALAPVQAAHPSRVSEVLATYAPVTAEGAVFDRVVAAGNAFLESLGDDRRAECMFDLDDAERSRWTNVPPGAEEGGVRLGDLNEEQTKRACDLLYAALSKEGYAKTRDIILGDDRLLRNGQARRGFGAENFWLVLFGRPHAREAWGLQLDGHHLALNLAFEGGDMCMTPTFLGAQPSDYQRGGTSIRPMLNELGQAFALVNSLTSDQRAEALVGGKRGQVEYGPGKDGEVPTPQGLSCQSLGEEQRVHLRALLGTYVSLLPEPFAGRRLEQLAAEVDEMHFAWSGPTENPSDVSYRLQSPSLLIEFACQDLGGKPLDHLHAMIRNPLSEYGGSLGGK